MNYSRTGKCPFDAMNEECGVFGVYSPTKKDLGSMVFYGLYALQHRGQESAGIAVSSGDGIIYHKGMGLVPYAFSNFSLNNFPKSNVSIGHVRYSTTGSSNILNGQPLVFTGKRGKIALAHNGNIVNSDQLREELIKDGVIFQTNIDTEVIAALINKYSDKDLIEGVKMAAEKLIGAFTLLIMTKDVLIAVRDSYGIRPLCLGKLDDNIIVSSETCALDSVRAEFVRDMKPGEILVSDKNGTVSFYMEKKRESLCIFEHVYFARPDSIIDGCSVYDARQKSGRLLAKKYPVDADIVSGVPDSAVVAARSYAEESGIPYVEALTKNRYVGRTFIQPDQKSREKYVDVKMNALKFNVEGKRLVLLDDSIVRGTTSKKIVTMLKKAGAKEVHLRICSPIIKHPCYFGIDMQTHDELIGNNRTEKEIAEELGADSVRYMKIEDLKEACSSSDLGFCMACFDGKYPMPVDGKDKDKLRLK